MSILLAACSSSNEASPSSTSSPASSASATSSCLTDAQAAVDAAKAPITIPELASIDTTSLAGKKFAVISLTQQSPLNVSQAEGVKSALETVGATTTIYDGKGTPAVLAQSFASAIGAGVSGIVTLGLDPLQIKNAIADADAAGIAVVLGSSVNPDTPHLPGVVANVAVDSTKQGVWQADWALVHTNCQVNGMTYFTTAGPVTVNAKDGTKAELDRLCGSACKVQDTDINAATFATAMPGIVTSDLQKNPDLNFIFSTADLFVPYIVKGRDVLDSTVPIGGAQGDTLDQAQAGGAQIMDIQWPPGDVNGWFMADTVIRGVLGQAKDVELPMRLLDASNWGTSTDFADQYPELVGFQEKFKTAWGVVS